MEWIPRHILVTGGTGFIGAPLCEHLVRAGRRVTVLTRDVARAQKTLGAEVTCVADAARARDVDAVVNLAGEPLFDVRWNRAHKERIVGSRVEGTRALVASMACMDQPPRVLVSASGVGYYGDFGALDTEVDESSSAGDDFAARLGVVWEHEAKAAETQGVRVALLRIGLVLGAGGGLLGQLLPIFRKGAGGPIGSGKQWMSWIHMNDLVRAIVHVLDHQEVRGPVNAVAPSPVTNRVFTRALGRVLGKATPLPSPRWLLRIVVGEGAEMIASGQRAVPRRLLDSGFQFLHPELEGALGALLEAPYGQRAKR